ncbi:MAG: hypothetical protein VKL39_13785 [Leptolyngbyaceae bacterium]|nr:hypothetical protein [Leptolyngbyaceae bacterium]
MRTETRYTALDGREFTTAQECRKHEKTLLLAEWMRAQMEQSMRSRNPADDPAVLAMEMASGLMRVAAFAWTDRATVVQLMHQFDDGDAHVHSASGMVEDTA